MIHAAVNADGPIIPAIVPATRNPRSRLATLMPSGYAAVAGPTSGHLTDPDRPGGGAAGTDVGATEAAGAFTRHCGPVCSRGSGHASGSRPVLANPDHDRDSGLGHGVRYAAWRGGPVV